MVYLKHAPDESYKLGTEFSPKILRPQSMQPIHAHPRKVIKKGISRISIVIAFLRALIHVRETQTQQRWPCHIKWRSCERGVAVIHPETHTKSVGCVANGHHNWQHDFLYAKRYENRFRSIAEWHWARWREVERPANCNGLEGQSVQ